MFYGRSEILARFTELWRKKVPSLVVCRGRRRIGKSTLLKQFAVRSGARFLSFEGLAPDEGMTNQDQLDEFTRRLARQTRLPKTKVSDWGDAFELLDSVLDNRETVVLLDEISWMGKYDHRFPAKLKVAWDNLFHEHPRLIGVLCGSVSTWIQKNILGSKGFVGRVSLDVVVPELPPTECLKFWGARAKRTDWREILDVLAVTGGVPRYLEEMDFALPADENIRRTCFTPEGYLFRDFNEIFNDMLSDSNTLKKDIRHALARESLGTSEIAERLDRERNGHMSEALEELKVAGFIDEDGGLNPATGRRARTGRYRIRDNYARFFLRYVLPVSEEIRRGAYRFSSLAALPGWESVMGFQFENLVMNNLPTLLDTLGLGNRSFVSAAAYRNKLMSRGGGCQIDLLLQTSSTAYVVEVKRRREIRGDVVDDVREKVARLPLRRGMSVRTVLVYAGELSPVVPDSDFFDFIIPAPRLFGIDAPVPSRE